MYSMQQLVQVLIQLSCHHPSAFSCMRWSSLYPPPHSPISHMNSIEDIQRNSRSKEAARSDTQWSSVPMSSSSVSPGCHTLFSLCTFSLCIFSSSPNMPYENSQEVALKTKQAETSKLTKIRQSGAVCCTYWSIVPRFLSSVSRQRHQRFFCAAVSTSPDVDLRLSSMIPEKQSKTSSRADFSATSPATSALAVLSSSLSSSYADV